MKIPDATIRAALLHAMCLALLAALIGAAPAHAQKKDYLTDAEADKIRDADTPAIRIKLFISFASLRIDKLKYEFAHPEDSLNREARMDGLVNSYTGCLDDAADLIDLGVEKQEDIREGVKQMHAQGPAFLAYLKQLDAQPGEAQNYKDNLDDAIESTTDALKSADEADKESSPPPVRRPQ